jgi:twinkle protein
LKYKLPCTKCGSSDAVTLYDDGHTHCYSCGKHTFSKEEDKNNLNEDFRSEPAPAPKKLAVPGSVAASLADRGIADATAKKYGVFKPEDTYFKVGFPLWSKGNHVATKFRLAKDEKAFNVHGEISHAELFGQSVFPAGSAKAITITEGYEDAMAAYEMTGAKYPCVSIHSAATASRDVANNFEYLNSFDEIVICFDKDEAKVGPDGNPRYPGQEAALAVAGQFKLGKVRILTLSRAKDSNDYLKAGLSKAFVDEWWKAPVYTPAGLKLPKDMWEQVSARKNNDSVPYPWDALNEFTYGIRLSEVTLITAETGVGKTSVVKEMEFSILQEFLAQKVPGKLGLLHLEESNEDTLIGLMSISAGKPLHLPDVRENVAEQELRRYFDETCNNDGMVVWDHFGSNSIEAVLNKIRHMHNLGCKYIFFDHLSIVVSDQSGDERKQLDEISTKLKTLCMELNIAVIAVIHQNRQGQIRGSAGPEQISNIVIKLSRDKEADDPWKRNVTKMVVQKNRFCGKTGPACYLEYVPETGRLIELTKDQIAKYESGQSEVVTETPW